jgi:molybdopterin synthase sulfur carrier subunit
VAKVVLSYELAQQYAAGEMNQAVEADNFRALVKALDARFPGLGAELKVGLAVAIDGEIFQEPFLEAIQPDSEVYFLPAIEGG